MGRQVVRQAQMMAVVGFDLGPDVDFDECVCGWVSEKGDGGLRKGGGG